MRKSLIAAITILVLPGAICTNGQEKKEPEQSGPYGTMVIRGATIIDGSGAPAFGPADIFVQGNKIVRIALTDAVAHERPKEDAAGKKNAQPDRAIDGKGMYVMPGNVDLHSHIKFTKDVPAEYIYKLYLGHGVTTIRTFNYGDADPKRMVEEKKKIAANQVIAPRVYVYPFWRGRIRGFRMQRGPGRLWMNGMRWAWMGSRFWESLGCGQMCSKQLRTKHGKTEWALRFTSGRTAFTR